MTPPISRSYSGDHKPASFLVPLHLYLCFSAGFLPASVLSGTLLSHAAVWRGRSRRKCSSNPSAVSHHTCKTGKWYPASISATNAHHRKFSPNSTNIDLPFILIQHQVAKNVFAHGVEGLNDFEMLGMGEFFCMEKITTRESVDRGTTTRTKKKQQIKSNQIKNQIMKIKISAQTKKKKKKQTHLSIAPQFPDGLCWWLHLLKSWKQLKKNIIEIIWKRK